MFLIPTIKITWFIVIIFYPYNLWNLGGIIARFLASMWDVTSRVGRRPTSIASQYLVAGTLDRFTWFTVNYTRCYNEWLRCLACRPTGSIPIAILSLINQAHIVLSLVENCDFTHRTILHPPTLWSPLRLHNLFVPGLEPRCPSVFHEDQVTTHSTMQVRMPRSKRKIHLL